MRRVKSLQPQVLLRTKSLVTIIKSGFSLTKILSCVRAPPGDRPGKKFIAASCTIPQVILSKMKSSVSETKIIFWQKAKLLELVTSPDWYYCLSGITIVLCLFWYYSYGLSEMLPRIWYCDMIRKGSTVPWVFNYRTVLFRYAGFTLSSRTIRERLEYYNLWNIEKDCVMVGIW